MGNIVLLDELTINKIAAGEVIERPASVIKEMIENSIDAKATNITVDIRNGGISYIKITDNGKGIARDDLELTFERHATSKIRSAEDLNTVTSMGFRGEAMASIAAIANVELVSKTMEQDVGYKIVVEGGNILEKEEVGCQTGTTITVKNLFFNTPVRYKFLKKDYTETGYIEDVVTRLAVVHPNISFKLINTGKTIIQTPGNGDIKSVIYSIFGRDVADGIEIVNYNYEGMRIKGVIGKPEIARSNRSNQLFFVNRRFVKDKILTAAAEQAYKGQIEAGKYGFIVLNIDMDPAKVDVNVHPAKLEVRFEEENKVFQAIYHAIKDVLEKTKEDTITKVDNIIIQSSNYAPKTTEIEDEDRKPKALGLFGWKKNKDFGKNSNIIEDLYNEKKSADMPFTSYFEDDKKENEEDDGLVNTSDALKELQQLQNNLKHEKEEIENLKKDENTVKMPSILNTKEENNLPDGTTYTYVGENKDRIEDLLRQLHPETYKQKTEVAEEKENYVLNENVSVENNNGFQENNSNNEVINQEQNFNEEQQKENNIEEEKEESNNDEVNPNEVNIQTENVAQTEEIKAQENKETVAISDKFNSIRENLRKLDSTQALPVITQEALNKENNQEKIEENKEKMSQENETIATNTVKRVDEDAIPKAFQNVSEEDKSDFSKMYEKMFGTAVIKDEKPQVVDERFNAVDIIKDNVSVFEELPTYQRPAYKFIGVVFGGYVVVEIEKEMYIINLNTAKEKIIFETLKKNYYNQVEKDSQMLLLPDLVEFTDKEMEILKENNYILEKAGFTYEDFGDNTVKLTGVPSICMNLNTKQLFKEIIGEINTVARTSTQEKEEKFMATIAEKVILCAEENDTLETIKNLLDKLLDLDKPFEYGFDRPIAIKMTKYDIERKFSRK